MSDCSTIHLGPLVAIGTGSEVRFTLARSPGFELDLPADYELQLREGLATAIAADGFSRAFIDLQDLPAITSYQLGALLALRKVLSPHQPRTPIINATPTVRRVLAATNTAQFFILE